MTTLETAIMRIMRWTLAWLHVKACSDILFLHLSQRFDCVHSVDANKSELEQAFRDSTFNNGDYDSG